MATDAFGGTGALGSDWTVVTGSFNQTGGNCYGNTGGTSSYAAWDAEEFGTDHEAWVVLQPRGSGQFIGPSVRASLAAFTCVSIDMGSDGLYLSIMTAGSQSLVSGYPISCPAAGTKVTLRAEGADVILLFDDVVQATHSGILSGAHLTNTRCGLVAYSNGTTTGASEWGAIANGGGGGTVVEKTAEDSVSVSDGGLLSRQRGAVATDTLLVTDASGFSREHQVSASDAFDLLDDASLSRMMGRVAGDSITVQDEISWHRLLFRLADDAITLIDAITAATSGGTLHEIVATDAIVLSDGTLRAVFLDRLAESGIELSDQAQQALERLRELGDTLLVEDGSIRTVSRYRLLESVTGVFDEGIAVINQPPTSTGQDVRILFGSQPDGIVFGSTQSIQFGGYN